MNSQDSDYMVRDKCVLYIIFNLTNYCAPFITVLLTFEEKKFGALHVIYYINRLIATKVD